VSSNSSGQITVPISAAVGTSVSAGAQSQLIAQARLIIYDAGTKIYDNGQEGYPYASNLYNYTATGNGSINASAYEY
jgi:hypothetical protein